MLHVQRSQDFIVKRPSFHKRAENTKQYLTSADLLFDSEIIELSSATVRKCRGATS